MAEYSIIISHKSFFLILLAEYIGIFSQKYYICKKNYEYYD